jgi:hypothetical protein
VRTRGRRFLKGVAILIAVIAFIVVVSFVVLLLWNALVPQLFHGPVLQYWQAVGLLILCRILLGGWRGRGGGHHRWQRRMWRERWEQMTPEERAQLKQRFAGRCGPFARAAQGEAPPPA